MADVEVGAQALNRGPAGARDVEVLLATWNGERFIPEQIDSILAQDYPRLRVLAGDDASTDSTPAILAEYAAKFPQRFRMMPAQPATGSARANFLRLMQAASGPYVCFADQDDVWFADKVSRSMEAMRALEQSHGSDLPLLVFTDLQVVDSELRTIAPSLWQQLEVKPENIHRLKRAVVQSIVTGCTMTINQRMLELARRMPPEATMHDRWIGLIAASMGGAAAVRSRTVLYRQHEANVVGATAPDDSAAGIARRAANSSGRRHERLRSDRQAEALLRVYAGEMPERSRRVLETYLRSVRSSNPIERMWLTLQHGFFPGGPVRTAAALADLARWRSDQI